jgi:pimeloyl-ACP methyl ester carboxylesterase
MEPHIFFLHGFLSGPDGTKARRFSERLAGYDIALRRPDLNTPDFRHMTITTMIEKVAAEVSACPAGPIYLIGSSLGGFVALHFLDRRPDAARRVEKLALLAPALDFPVRFRRAMAIESPDFEVRWREAGILPMFHHAYDRKMPLGYGFVEDLAHYSDGYDVKLDIPTVIAHGRYDEGVDPQLSIRFAAGRPNVSLHLLESDHQMLDSLSLLWTILRVFFDL